MVSQEVMDWYSWIWTTHRNEYFLVGDEGHYAIVRINENSWCGLIIENDEAYFAVCERMRQEGIPVVTSQEWSRLNQLWRERYNEKQEMEKEKRNPQPRKSSLLLYVGMILLGCAACFGTLMFFAYFSDCTWNQWYTPKLPVPISSTVVSETYNSQFNSQQRSITLVYVDDKLSDEDLAGYFDLTSLCPSYTYLMQCSGRHSFWGTQVSYNLSIEPTDRLQRTTQYSISQNWKVCSARSDN